ncbi:putative histidine kinase group protein [Podospora appendiculata]|uniref:Histidine kinase group protein n=1 Tax=Podospora appendiculata TaxID=314037 RepID=A0AAE1CGB9_9PEZI|nr:putative histidine kinase group protein [Podospora appendiculata]
MTLESRVEPRTEPRISPHGAADLGSQTSPILSPSPAFEPAPSPPGLPDPLVHPIFQNSQGWPDGSIAKNTQRPVGGCAPDNSRHDLTSSTIACRLSETSPAKSPASTKHQPPSTACPLPEAEIGGPPGSLGKRPSEEETRQVNALASPSKKPRLVAPGSLRLPPPPRTADELRSGHPDVTSPLFFSHSSRHVRPLPHGFSLLENAAISMMGAVHETHDGVTTLRLPKAQVGSASSARTSSSQSMASGETPDSARSPDGRPIPPAISRLQGIGVIELVEQDERPTFIIDLANPANFNPGPLEMVFANAALRAARGVLDLLQPGTADQEHSADFARFKAWTLSFVKNNQSTDVCLPSLSYGGISWTCSTVRRRFRFVSGNRSAVSITPTSSSPIAQASSVLDERARGPAQTITREPIRTPREGGVGDDDYFGLAGGSADGSVSPSAARIRAHSEPRSRTETALDTHITPYDDMALLAPLPMNLLTTFDWTRIPPDDPNLGAHHRFARSVDWASTSLGPMEDWPSDLRIMSNMIMGSPHPAAMYWGEDFVAIYNEAYIALAGKKHPQLMGSRYQDAWAELWDEIKPVMDAAWNNGDATMKHDDLLFLTRHGFLEETFFNWAIIPLVGGDGTVVALYNPAFENTRRKINERRMLTLQEVGIKTSQARDVKGFWSQVQKGLEFSPHDVPFALIYSVGEDSESEVSSINSGSFSNPPQIVLEGALGVPEGHPSAVSMIDLRTSDEGFAPYMRDSMVNPNSPVILSEEDGTLPSDLIQGFTWRGFGDPCRTIVVFPVHPTTAGDMVVGFIVLGVNPRRSYDESYQLFVSLLSRQLATSMASVVLFEEEIKRGQKAARLAALDRQRLSMQLHLRTQEAVESEYRFTRMAEFGPVGLFIADGLGEINYCNDMWWKISGHERSTSTLDAWMQSIRDEDRPGVEDVWRRLVEERVAVTHEFRFKGSRQIIDGHSVDTWALMSAYPEKDEYGSLKSIFGCITDISQQKWAEDFQKQRREEAVEMKRQQENFIDITSHEMRNPLSAILQCADEISTGLSQYRQSDPSSFDPGALNMLIDRCVEAANTISLCAGHQKRIVDDILTLSKLDSNLLLVTPVDVQPVTVVQNVLRMFETELSSNGIRGHFRVEQSYRDLAIDWVKLDPSRLRQVLINLMTNAIKFTQGRPTRSIVLSLGASRDISSSGFWYFPPRLPDQEDITDDPEWADGEKINLHLAVTDSGPGLDDDEKKILFQRFSQASPRTHVQYGGSGLGLFICRILTELQGGQIGVRSEKNEGSTFAFYIKSRRTEHRGPDLSTAAPIDWTSTVPKPASTAPAQHVQHPAGPAPSTQLQAEAHLRGKQKALDVLIVEDNIVNQRVLQRQLQLSGNNTYVANHGGEALEKLQQSRYWDREAAARCVPLWTPSTDSKGENDKATDHDISVILMDLEMPVMDGMSCTREIRRLENAGAISHHIPIIAVTAYARPEQIENAKAAGVDDVISKPFRIPELIPKIQELVAKYNTDTLP